MIASVLIEYQVKTLNKVFDYIIPDNLIKDIKVGHKVMVPFGTKQIEGFVLKIHNNIDNNIKYRSIVSIVEKDFYLNDELLSLGKIMSKTLITNLISCYQAMLPRALKASIKTNINRKYETKVKLNSSFNIDEYIELNKRNKREIELLNIIKDKEILKSSINGNSLRNLISKGIVIEYKTEINRKVLYNKGNKKEIFLTNEQKNTYEEIIKSKDDKFLLHGVTGSGKTEIYIEIIKNVLKNGKTAIVLVPEISLTPQIVERFVSVFGENVAVFHSALSEGEKYDEYRRIMNGKVSVVVGARSAIFIPIKNIGIIIVDECQSQTYKQENNPKYNAIDIAFLRGKYNKCKVVLGSATPSLEQYARGKKGVYHLLKLNNRISKMSPKYELVDMESEAKKHNYIISSVLDSEIKLALERKEQIILLLNRRGYSTYLSCTNCGYVYKCPNCDISLTYHKSSKTYSCHYCGYRVNYSTICPKCKEDAIKDLGLGTEKLEDLIKKKYNTSVLRMDSDTTSSKNAHQKLINEFSNNKYSILVGTQMISKGLNFENVSLVGIINPDTLLSIPDFRSAEITYELLSQTSGRVGRFNLPGKVVIQTYNIDNYVYSSVIKENYEDFYNYEMNIRKKLNYPPYYYICSIVVSSSVFDIAGSASNKVKKFLDNNLSDKYIIIGPSVSNIVKLNNRYRFNIMIKYKDNNELINVLNKLNEIIIKDVKLDININI